MLILNKKLFSFLLLIFLLNSDLIIVNCWQGICETQGLVDVGAGIEGTCDGIATFYQGRCCLPTTTTTIPTIPITTTIVTTTTKICLYNNGIFYMCERINL
uniref:CC domain-containing protein n=1 Tax=Meloidogyne hapla TaxID=6305 RepID=A0A1I8C0L4_MELHA